VASEEHETMVRAGIAGLIIVAAIIGIGVIADLEHHHRAKRVMVLEAIH
jgi:hypothetical protein